MYQQISPLHLRQQVFNILNIVYEKISCSTEKPNYDKRQKKSRTYKILLGSQL